VSSLCGVVILLPPLFAFEDGLRLRSSANDNVAAFLAKRRGDPQPPNKPELKQSRALLASPYLAKFSTKSFGLGRLLHGSHWHLCK
jgi:hypothetical protein